MSARFIVWCSNMSRAKLIGTTVLLFGLGGLCLYLNRDWFQEQPIQIHHRVSPWMQKPRPARAGATELGAPVVFGFDRFYRFTSIRVVKAAEIATNKYAAPLWELTSTSNSMPAGSIVYGERVRGMQPPVRGARPDPLEPGVTYRLLVTTADKKQAHHDFALPPKR